MRAETCESRRQLQAAWDNLHEKRRLFDEGRRRRRRILDRILHLDRA